MKNRRGADERMNDGRGVRTLDVYALYGRREREGSGESAAEGEDAEKDR